MVHADELWFAAQILLVLAVLLLSTTNHHPGQKQVFFVTADNEVRVLQALNKVFPDWFPNAMVDVGASKGRWTQLARKIVGGNTPNVFMLETTEFYQFELESVKRR